MPPQTLTGVDEPRINVKEKEAADAVQSSKSANQNSSKITIKWKHVLAFIVLHIAAIYGGWLALVSVKLMTIGFVALLYIISFLGITAGAHRLWAHRAYKAKTPLKIILMIFNTVAFQDCVVKWCRDHRVHHKYSDTDGDPHNSNRGFFYSHIGWLLCIRHSEATQRGKQIELDDLLNDPVLRFQKNYYIRLGLVFWCLLPTLIPWYLWSEHLRNAFFVCVAFRYTLTLHVTWLVNSAAHLWGNRPYERSIRPVQHKGVAFFTLGEGWHNYHHVFPWDYKTAELGNYSMNLTTGFIDLMARIGWAYDLKRVSEQAIEMRCKKSGDGSHEVYGHVDVDENNNEY